MAISKTTQKRIVELYAKKKLSAAQIAEKLDLSASVVHYWLIKQNVRKRTISEAVTNLHLTKFKKKQFSLKEIIKGNDNELKISGIMLYWGEGGKTGNTVKFVNSDPKMIKLFLNFLRTICGVQKNRLKALIHMYPDQNEKKLKNFWSKITKIPKKQFYKSCIHKGKSGTYKNKVNYGTIAINYSDKKLLRLLLSWIDQYNKKLI